MPASLPPLPIDDVLPALHTALAAGPYAVLVAPPGASAVYSAGRTDI